MKKSLSKKAKKGEKYQE